MQFGARILLALFLFSMPIGLAWAGDEKPLTQRHVNRITETAAAPGEAEAAAPPLPVHPLSDEDRAALKETHRVISGKSWRAMSPQERDVAMRNLHDTNAKETIFVIDVRTGDVYKFDPPVEDQRSNVLNDQKLSDKHHINMRFFWPEDLLKLAVAVAPDNATQDDRSISAALRGAPVRIRF